MRRRIRWMVLCCSSLLLVACDDAAVGTSDTGFDVAVGDASSDANPTEVGPGDVETTDLGSADLGPADLGPADLGPADLGPADLGPADLGSADLGPADLGPADLGPADLGPADLGVDAGDPCDLCAPTALCSAGTCSCPTGYAGDGTLTGTGCSDADECALGTDLCDANATCANSVGGYACTCDAGYTGDGIVCTDDNECMAPTPPCGADATCTNSLGGFTCACLPGYDGDGIVCSDVDECTLGTDTCDANADCTNTVGSFTCACRVGFTGDGQSCSAVIDCVTTPLCAVNATCVTTGPSPACVCNNGYDGDGLTCTDTDECATSTDNCSDDAACTNTVGSFTCACLPGFSGDGVACTDVDECALGTDTCDANATCTNTAGTFTCACDAGFTGDGTTCVDVDECSAPTAPCSADATCTNTSGSYVCACNAGYGGDGVTCGDVDECALGTDTCDANADCTNTVASFTCACRSGYTGDGQSCSLVVDCFNTPLCDANATCVTTGAMPTCVCNTGYDGDGTSCADVNECVSGTDDCSSDAVCTNAIGGFSCACLSGFTGNGVTCDDIDECALDLDGCDALATCTNTPGGFDCTCPSGFAGDGSVCTDVDECGLGLDDCDENATCTNTAGSFTCACNAPATGGGTSCACPASTTGVGCNFPTNCVGVLRTGTGTTSGLYTVDPDGSSGPIPPLQVYCDMQYQGGGWTMLVSSGPGGTQNIPAGTPNATTRAYLPLAVMQALAGSSDTVHIRTAGDALDSVTSRPGSTPIANLRLGRGLYTDPTQYLAGDWSGPRASTLAFSCPPVQTGYPVTIYHACNNASGLHWGADTTAWSLSAGENTLELYVREEPCGSCPSTGVCSFDGSDFGCVDVDECAAGTDACATDATCTNLDPSYSCACNAGYGGTGLVCSDLDECALGTDTCDANATCTNTTGSFTCACNPGYTGNGTTCSQLVDCVVDPMLCGANATCIAGAPGASYCACDAGYTGDGVACTDLDECALGTDTCDANATCTNTTGSFTCACDAGYDGSGTTCTDVDECATDADDCDANATCTNTAGSFTCACNAPSTGDGRTCACPGDTTTADCSVPTTCIAVRRYGFGIASGVYTLDVDGDGPLAPTDVYCDMDHEGGGWALIIAGGPGGTSTIPAVTPTAAAFGRQPLAVMRALAQTSDVVHIRTRGAPYSSITSVPGSTPILNLRNGAPVYASAGQYSPFDFTGYYAGSTWLGCDPYMGGYPDNIYEACGNATGLTWTPNQATWNYSTPGGELELYVRPDACAGACAASEVCGFDGTDFACVDRNECAAGLDDCSEHATCTNTVGSYTCACIPPATGDGVDCQCPTGLTGPACNVAESCVGVLRLNGAVPSGSYTVDPDGSGTLAPMSVYCDMTHDGGGWTLIMSGGPGGTSTIPAVTPTATNYGRHPLDVTVALARASDTVHVRTRGVPADSITSVPGNLVITNLRAGAPLVASASQYSGALFTGPRASNNWLGCDPYMGGYPNNIYESCGNASGLTWTPGQTTWNYSTPDGELELWVREEPCANGCTAGETCSLVGLQFRCVDENECLIGTDDCSAQATCTNTVGSFSCACNPGYVGDGRTCVDEDECLVPDLCPLGTACRNTDGSYVCE